MKISLIRTIVLGSVLCTLTLLQSFQCASPNMTNGRESYRKKDYSNTIKLMQLEVEKNPQNAEAWYYLGAAQRNINDYQSAVTSMTKALDNAQDLPIKKDILIEQYNLWVAIYNEAASLTTSIQLGKSKDAKQLSNLVNMCITLRPEDYNVYSWLGGAYEMIADTSSALTTYSKFMDADASALQFAKSKSVYMKQSREDVLSKLGKPIKTKGFKSGKDSIVYDLFTVGNDKVHILSEEQKNKTFAVQGWKINLPTNRAEGEAERAYTMDIAPYTATTNIYYRKKDFNKALEFIEKATILTPDDPQISNFKLQIYDNLGRSNEVLKTLEELVKAEPNNKVVLTQYASGLSKAKKQDEAIKYYEKALSIDPNYDIALYNIAAEYKNKASEIQKTEKEKREKDAKYKENESMYFPILSKSAEYFSRYKNLPEHRRDFSLLVQLSNIYEVTRDITKLKLTIADLESIEPEHKTNPTYYEIMGGIYLRQGQKDKSKNAYDTADKIRGK